MMKKDSEDSRERIGCTTAIGRAVLTSTALALISYVALLLIGRTDGFRQIATDHVSKLLDLELRIEQVEINSGLALVLSNVSHAVADADGASASADSLLLRYRLRLAPWPRLTVKKVELEGLRLDFVRTSGGAYEPHQLSPMHAMLSELLELPPSGYEPAQDLLSDILETEVCWRINAGLIRWLAENGFVLREVANLDLEVTPLGTSSTRFNFIDLEMRHREGAEPYEDIALQKVILHRDEGL